MVIRGQIGGVGDLQDMLVWFWWANSWLSCTYSTRLSLDGGVHTKSVVVHVACD